MASINVRAVNQWRCGGNGPNAGSGGEGGGNKNKVFISKCASDGMTRELLRIPDFVEGCVVEGARSLCRLLPCAHVGERLKPERR